MDRLRRDVSHVVRPGRSWTQVSHLWCPIATGFDSGTITFRIDHTPLHRISIQFEWAWPFGELPKKQKIGQFWGHVGFRQKNVCLSTQLGACSHAKGGWTGLYWCTIDVRTPWARHGVPTGPPGPRRAATAARRPAGGSVRLIFIGGPRFGRPAGPIGGGRGYCFPRPLPQPRPLM